MLPASLRVMMSAVNCPANVTLRKCHEGTRFSRGVTALTATLRPRPVHQNQPVHHNQQVHQNPTAEGDLGQFIRISKCFRIPQLTDTQSYGHLYLSQSSSEATQSSQESIGESDNSQNSTSVSTDTDTAMVDTAAQDTAFLMKRVLCDYIYNIYERYHCEFPDDKISLTVFQHLRPKHVSLWSFLRMSQCLCAMHQDFAHLLLSLKNAFGESFSLSPDKFSATVNIPVVRNILLAITTAHVAFRVWKKANDPYMNKLRYQLLTEQMEVNEYKAHVEKTAEKFCHHKRRIKAQYSGVKDITVKLG